MKQTKQTLYLLIAISIIFLITACPYSSEVPIDNPSIEIQKILLGQWVKAKDIDKKKPDYFNIKDVGNKQYDITKFEYRSSDSAYRETKYIAHLSKIEDLSFLNMQKNGSGSYYLYRIDFDKNRFTLFELTDNIDEKFTTSKALKAFVKKYMRLSFFYSKEEETYIKY